MRSVRIALVLVLLLAGCTVGRGTGAFPPAADMNAQPGIGPDDDGRDYRILVANGLSENITMIGRADGVWSVSQDIVATGQAPNQMLVLNGLCYVVNSLSNSVQIIDSETLDVVREISTGPGTNPVFMDFIDDDTAIVSCYLSNEVLLIDVGPDAPPEDRIIERIPLPPSTDLPRDDDDVPTNAKPGGLKVVGDKCYVACSNLKAVHVAGGPGLLAVIDIPSRSVERMIELSGRDTVQVIHSPRFPRRLTVLSAGDNDPAIGFVGNGTVESLNLDTGEIFQVIEVAGAPFGGVIGPDDILLMENGREGVVLRVDLFSGVELPAFALPSYGEPLSYASSILALPGLVCVTNFNADRFYLLEPDSGEILAELATGDGPDAMVLAEGAPPD